MHNRILKYIFAAENLLLIWLMVLPFLSMIIVADSAIDIQLHDTYGMMPILHALYYTIIVGICITYIVHIVLRTTDKRQPIICNGHIWLTILSTAIVIIDFYVHVPREAEALTGTVPVGIDRYFLISENRSVQFFLFLQLLFISYGTVRIIRTKK